jgi:hypothetical protein
MYTKLFKNAFLAIKYDDESMVKFIAYYRNHFQNDPSELMIIDGFATIYKLTKVIRRYTRECFWYRMLNHSLRCLDASIMVDMSFFIRDLHQRLDRLHREQLSGYHGKSITVYRGRALSTKDFQRIRQSKGGLISFNNFLSTSINPSISHTFMVESMRKPGMFIVLFVITVDPSVSTTLYANIRAESEFQNEDEILFFMHSVFRIVSIHSVPEKTASLTISRDKWRTLQAGIELVDS